MHDNVELSVVAHKRKWHFDYPSFQNCVANSGLMYNSIYRSPEEKNSFIRVNGMLLSRAKISVIYSYQQLKNSNRML
jgi:hypothetical protein